MRSASENTRRAPNRHGRQGREQSAHPNTFKTEADVRITPESCVVVHCRLPREIAEELRLRATLNDRSLVAETRQTIMSALKTSEAAGQGGSAKTSVQALGHGQ
jgi:hypothetical protein